MNLIQLDHLIFAWINQKLTHPLLDSFFIFWTDFQQTPLFYILLIPLLAFIFWRGRATGIAVFLFGIVAVGVADKLNSKVLKPVFDRPRPVNTNLDHEVILRIPEVGGSSLPSSHAVDAFCLLAFVSCFYPRLFFPLGILAVLTAYSRVYCGVHFPADVIVGAVVGLFLGYLFARMKHLFNRILRYILLFVFSFNAHGMQDPTGGKPFFPWLWQDQFKPTIKAAGQKSNLYVLGGGAALTAASFSEDDNSKDFAVHVLTEEQARMGSKIGGGPPLIGLALIQIMFDQEEGLAHGRAIALTAFSHITIAAIVQRERPNKSPTRLAFPSGHVSHAFTSATSLAYSYGPWIGTFAYGIATWSAVSRLRDEAHWVSDVVAGAGLGIFWGRASAMAKKQMQKPPTYTLAPLPLNDGAGLIFSAEF